MIVSMGFNGKQENVKMSTENHEIMKSWAERYKIIKKRFFDVFGENGSYENFQKYLGLGRGKMSARVRSLSSWTADEIMVLHEKLGLSLEWIFYGTGPVLSADQDVAPKPSLINQVPEKYGKERSNQSLLDQCRHVLESGTFYASALESNIIAFNSAVLVQAMQKNLESRMAMLQAEVSSLKDSSDRGKAVGGL